LNISVSIVTHVFSFHELLKLTSTAKAEGADAGGRGHSDKAIDSETAKVVDETSAGVKGPTTIEGGGG
jgi:hypothetical protein